ncbi:MAG TPA: hypothetical protein VFX58_01230 [Chitinophagaceae bacterium]|nr:hypothetical protein [Chitinophagaceae bacterium]
MKNFTADSFSPEQYAQWKTSLGKYKEIPASFEKPILIALSFFPQLSDIAIEFRVKPTRVPLASRPAWSNILFSHSQRKYIITISSASTEFLSPILMQQLDFNSQVGVIGHELSHIIDFSTRGTAGLIRIGLGNLSSKFMDRFEFRTDSICIAQGLGYQLLSWSMYVRKAFGANLDQEPMMRNERYMHPATIRKRMATDPRYNLEE